MNNRRIIGGLLALLVTTLAINVLLSRRAPSTGLLRNRPLLDPALDIDAISIERPGEPLLAISRGDRWSMTKPFAVAADEQAILRLIDTFTSSSIEDVLLETELLKLGRTRDDFGFAEPCATISFSNSDRCFTYQLGERTPSSNSVYVAKTGLDAVLVVPARVLDLVSAPADAFRERVIFPYDPDFVLGFDVKLANAPLLALVREGENWQVDGGVASGVKVREFLSQIADANAIEFLWARDAATAQEGLSNARLSAYGLDAETALVVVFHCLDGSDQRILLGHDVGSDETYALVHNGNAVVTVPSSLKSALLQGSHTFADSRLFPVEESAVTSFSIQADDKTYLLARDADGSWRLDSPIVAPAAPEVVSAILGRLVSLTPRDFALEGLKVSVSTNLSSCLVSPTAVLGDACLEDLRSREILSIDPARVRRLVLTPQAKSERPAETVAYSRERRAWDIESEEASPRTADENGIHRVLAALAPLRAERIVAISATVADLRKYGLENPFCTLAIDQEKEGAVRRNVLIGSEDGKNGRFATVGSSEAVFILSKKTVSDLTASLIE